MDESKKGVKRKKGPDNEELKKKKKKSKGNVAPSESSESVLPPKPEVKEKKKRKRDEESTSKPKKKSKSETEPKVEAEELEIDLKAPTPPSKKALRLQKKGKPVPKLPSTSRPPTTLAPEESTEDNVHPERKKLLKEIPRAEWSVWIGNLAYKSDVKALRGWLVRSDKRVTDKEITRINLPLNADGQPKGFAYVDFSSKEAMDKVISRSEEALDGRKLLIKNAKSFEGRPAQTKQRYQVRQKKFSDRSAVPREGVGSEDVKEEDAPKTEIVEKEQKPDKKKKEKKKTMKVES